MSPKLVSRKSRAASRQTQIRYRPRIEILEDRTVPAILMINSLLDPAFPDLTDSVVTLRDALYAANHDVQVSPGGPTGSGADEIQFQTGLSGIIQIHSILNELEVSSNLTITGPGANLEPGPTRFV